MDVTYDCEVFPNCFMLCANDGSYFEISTWRNDVTKLREWVLTLKNTKSRMVGFNNIGFDYPVLHFILTSGISDPLAIYNYAMRLITTENKFGFTVKPSDCWVPQIDLFKIHHFDNKSRMTSLKSLEFNMRMDNISDLPFPVGTILKREQVEVLRNYCRNDVLATELFYNKTTEQIAFREQLSKKHSRDFMNYSDVKIGKEVFQISLENAGIPCYNFGPDGRTPRQTPRLLISLGDCVPPFIHFEQPAFNKILEHFNSTVISETKGAFKDLSATVCGLEFVFGTGGIHASVENENFVADDDMMIYDVDVTSLYPSIAITNGYYPEHLGTTFVKVYSDLRDQRLQYKKNTAENAMLKLALNGVYGASNDKFSAFYDPLFTMKITVGGQLMLAMLAEQLLRLEGLRIIQCNTDGITLYMPRTAKFIVDGICHQWEQLTKLSLEYVEYRRMIIADVNSYIAVKTDGTVKRKGRYEWDVDWHQDSSALVVPKVAEKVIVEGANIRETLENWPDRMDFMLRAKAPKGSTLVLEHEGRDFPLEHTQRYLVSPAGLPMVKVMPPLAKDPDQWRRIAIQKGYKVVPCNNIHDADNVPIDYDWYANETYKLTLGVI